MAKDPNSLLIPTMDEVNMMKPYIQDNCPRLTVISCVSKMLSTDYIKNVFIKVIVNFIISYVIFFISL